LEVLFSDGFDRQSLALGIGREKVLALVERARFQEVSFGDLIVRLIIDKEGQADSYLLLIAQVKPTSIHPDVIFRVHPDLYPNIMMLEPMMVLQLLAQKFGMVLHIGNRLARFYYQEEVALTMQDNLSSAVQIIDETGHDCFGSFYVKLVETGSKRAVNCALAFCIDKVFYNDWLARPGAKKELEDPSHRPVTRIVPLQRALEVRRSCMSELTIHDRFYKTELRLSIEIIVKLLGDAWYRRVYESLPKVAGQEDPQLLHWYVRIIGLGHFLNQLWRADDSNNLSDKIDELRGTSFEHTYFELKIAAQFDRDGFDVVFVKRKKMSVLGKDTWLKTPDLQLNAKDGYAFVECKRKSATGLSIDNEVDDAASQIQEYGGPGVIIVELQEKLNQESVKGWMRERGPCLKARARYQCLCLPTKSCETKTIRLWWPPMLSLFKLLRDNLRRPSKERHSSKNLANGCLSPRIFLLKRVSTRSRARSNSHPR